MVQNRGKMLLFQFRRAPLWLHLPLCLRLLFPCVFVTSVLLSMHARTWYVSVCVYVSAHLGMHACLGFASCNLWCNGHCLVAWPEDGI